MEKPTHFSYARRARQFVEGTKIQERYLCGPGLEAQLTGRAESAVEGCRPGWLSTEHGVETLLRFFRTRCAKLTLPDMGSHLQASFYKLKRKKYEPMATWSTRYRNEYTKVRRALARLQRTESPDDTEVMQIPIHGPVGIGTPGRQTSATPGVKQQHSVLKIMMKHHLCFLNRCLHGFFSTRADSRQERET